MNIFQEIKALFTVKSVGEDIIKEASIMNGTKPGWQTTEFWGKVAVQVTTLWGACKGFFPTNYALMGSVALEAVYNVSRMVIKAVSDFKSAQSSTPPASA